jgi:hypothetical protein
LNHWGGGDILASVTVDGDYVKEGIAARLLQMLPDVERYKEGQEQNFKRESIVIHQLITETDKQMNNRFRRRYRMRLHFFPKKSDPNPRATCDNMGSLLCEYLYMLPLPGYPVFGQSMEWEIVENVLHFSVDYVLWLDLEELGSTEGEMLKLELLGYDKSSGNLLEHLYFPKSTLPMKGES